MSVGKAFIRWLLENRYLFREGETATYATRPNNECFEVKEWFDRETEGGVTLVTPRGGDLPPCWKEAGEQAWSSQAGAPLTGMSEEARRASGI
ncbi:MAG: hypothetical protein ACLRZ3_05645 [Flavonifractor plautii]